MKKDKHKELELVYRDHTFLTDKGYGVESYWEIFHFYFN